MFSVDDYDSMSEFSKDNTVLRLKSSSSWISNAKVDTIKRHKLTAINLSLSIAKKALTNKRLILFLCLTNKTKISLFLKIKAKPKPIKIKIITKI